MLGKAQIVKTTESSKTLIGKLFANGPLLICFKTHAHVRNPHFGIHTEIFKITTFAKGF